MDGIEFRISPDGNVYFKEGNKEEKRLTRFEKVVCLEVADIIESRFPGAWARLRSLYPEKGKTSAEKDKQFFKIIDRFIRCNFGEHDLLTPDIEHKILHFEEVRCPLRGGLCPDENIICKPQSLVRLSPAEKEVAILYLYGYTFDEIAKELKKAPSTVKVQLHNIKNKLSVKNCREIIKVMRYNQF